jgi:predicted RNase H-like HicB family nuclease
MVNKNKNIFSVEFGRETDGRWIAEISKLPGVLAYGETKAQAKQKVYALALRVLADKAEHGRIPVSVSKLFTYGMAGC